MSLEKLSRTEQETFDFIGDVAGIQITNLPNRRMFVAIPRLKNRGLVEVLKKYTNIFRRKKKKFVRVRNNEKPSED